MGESHVSYLIDMDGVLYRGSQALPGARRFMERLARRDRAYMLVTNDSAYTREDIHARLQGIGIDVSVSAIYTSAMATAAWVRDHMAGQSVMLVGERGLHAAFQETGVETVQENPDCLVIGELTQIDATALSKAAAYASKGVQLIGTNPDLFVPSTKGARLGCGAIAAIFEKVAGKAATFIGKPDPRMFEYAMSILGVNRENVVVIGDNMQTDILGAERLGLQSILVLTGVSQAGDLESYSFCPTRVVRSLDEVEH